MMEPPTHGPRFKQGKKTPLRKPPSEGPVPPWTRVGGRVRALQCRLSVGSSDHPLERDANRVADAVLAGGAGADSSRIPAAAHQGDADATAAAEAPTSVQRALAQPGRPLDPAVRSDIEPRFGHDFSHVRIHDGAAATEAAAEIGAEAFTAGSHVVFAQGRFAPDSGVGQRLLVHELAHVVQHAGGDGAVLRRQSDGRKKKKTQQAPAKADKQVKKPTAIGGEVAEGEPLSSAELAEVQEVGGKVPARFRRYVAYKDVIKVGGSLAWRFNNPGNLRSSGQQLKQLKGGTGKFAAFKDMATGRAAQKDLYINRYGEMSVREAVEKLTPRSENDTDSYLKALAKGGVDLDKKVAPQIDVLMREVEKNEGLIEGITLTRSHPEAPASPDGTWRGFPWAAPEQDGSRDPWSDLPWIYPDDR